MSNTDLTSAVKNSISGTGSFIVADSTQGRPKKCRQRIYNWLMILLLQATVLSAAAAQSVTFTVGSTSVASGSTVNVPVTVSGFSLVTTMQFTVQWDPTILTFVGTGNYNSTLNGLSGLSAGFGTTATATGKLTFSWDDPTLNGATLADGTTIFTVQFQGAGGGTAAVSLIDVPTGREVTENIGGNPTTVTFVTQNGSVQVLAAPSITVQPQAATAPAGSTVTLSVTATGTTPLTYQWKKDGTAISGATSATLTINNAQVSDSGSYTVVVSNNIGSATSSAATVTVFGPPTITVQPQATSAPLGGSASFSITATGGGTLTYQWKKDGVNISGATSASLTLNNLQASDAASYTVAVSNAAGSVTSSGAALTVFGPPTINTQPQSANVGSGTSITFTVAASGGGTLTYQWQKSGVNINGATGASLTINGVQASDAGNYTVVVSNAAGSVTSGAAALTVFGPPVITVQPAGGTFPAGTMVDLTVTATGTAVTYQWQKNGANIAGATSSTLSFHPAQASDTGNYTVLVSNAAGTVTSSTAALTIFGAPAITVQPQSINAAIGTTVNLSVTATGGGTITYQWQKNGNNISGATSATFSLPNAQSTDSGTYSVVVTNEAGSTTSAVANVTVSALPIITAQPQGGSVPLGGSITLTVTATSAGPITYQWQKGGVNISGATSASLALNNVQNSAASDYTVVVSNAAGSVTSSAATVTVFGPPTIATQPAGGNFALGSSATLTVVAAGTGPFTYQWQKNGANVSGATTSSLALNNLQASDAGSYTVVVGNAAGTVTSAAAVVTVYGAPAIASAPQNVLVAPGATAVFSVTASGTGPFTYQWRKNGTAIAGATSSTLTINNSQTTDEGSYTVVVSNAAGSTTSSAATLTISTVPVITSQPQDATVLQGLRAVFSVTATGIGPFSYQWKKDGSIILGATTATFTIASAQSSDAGSYTVTVSNQAGPTTSRAAQLTVLSALTITSQPQNLQAPVGATATFQVTAVGAGTLNYQWQKNGVTIAGATSAALVLNNVQPADAGNYTVTVSNSLSSSTSAAATLTVLIPPTITSIADQTVFMNQPTPSLAFTIASSSADIGSLNVAVSISTADLIGSVTLGGSGANRTVTITPAANRSGTANVTLTVTDSFGQTASTSFKLTVISNTVPTISAVADQTVSLSTPFALVMFQVSDGGTPASQLVITASSSDQSVLPTSNIFKGGSSTNRALFLVLPGGQAGTTVITVSVSDGQLSTSTSFKLTVRAPIGPTISAIADQTTTVDHPTAPVSFTVGDSDATAGAVTISAVSSNHDVVADNQVTIAGSGAARTITVTPKTGASGDTFITVKVTDVDDGLSATTTFKVSVTAASAGTARLLFEDAGGFIGRWTMQGEQQTAADLFDPSNVGDPGWKIVSSADFNGDGKPDILFQHEDGTLAVWFMDGLERTSSAYLNPLSAGSRSWHAVAVGDLDGDGKPDIFFQHVDGTLGVWFMDGINRKSAEFLNPDNSGADWKLVGSGRFDSIHKLSLVFQHADGTLGIWPMNGIDRDVPSLLDPSQPSDPAARVVSVVDLDGDGHPDLVFQNPTGDLKAWFMNGTARVRSAALVPPNSGGTWRLMGPK